MSKATTIGQRFTQLIQQLGITKNAFAQSIGRTATVVQHLVDERNYPGYELLCKVVEIYPNVSLDWLMLDKGPMLHSNSPELLVDAGEPIEANSPAMEPIDLASLAPPVRRRNGSHLQPTDIAATLTLASKTAKPSPAPPVNSPSPPPAEPAANTVPPAAAAPSPAVSLVAATPPDASYLTAALQTQYLQHQLALAEQRNQHLLAQQALLQQMVALLQKTA